MDEKMNSGFWQTILLGLSSSATGGMVYSYIISLDTSYFAPVLGIVAGLLGGAGIAVKTILSGENIHEEIPLSRLVNHILFGIIALVFGYILVFYFVKLPVPGMHDVFLLPVEMGTLDNFFKQTLRLPDIMATVLGALCSAGIPLIFKEKILVLVKKSKSNRFR